MFNRIFKQKSKAEPLPMLLSKAERECLLKYAQQVSTYFEYGCGGSTQRLADMTHLTEIVSVESDFTWAEKISKLCPRVNMYWVDIGPTKEYGWPKDESCKVGWPRYPEVWLKHGGELVLLDGRFRVACALLICLQPKNVKYVIFDDFKDREAYHVIMPFIEVVDFAGSAIVFRPAKQFDRDACQALYDKYKLDPN